MTPEIQNNDFFVMNENFWRDDKVEVKDFNDIRKIIEESWNFDENYTYEIAQEFEVKAKEIAAKINAKIDERWVTVQNISVGNDEMAASFMKIAEAEMQKLLSNEWNDINTALTNLIGVIDNISITDERVYRTWKIAYR